MDKIEYRVLGDSGINVTAMGIGTQAWGKESFGYGSRYTEKDVFEAFQASLDAGVNFFDTSDSYAKGESERLLGKFFKNDGRPVVIASKFTKSKWYDPGNYKSPKDVLPAIDNSLNNLGLKQLDLYQMHYPESQSKINGYLDALAETVKSGKAKSIGLCNFSADRLRYAYEYLDKKGVTIASNQIGYNLLFRHPETNGLLKTCDELNVAPIAILPLAEGILTGKYRVGGLDYPKNVKSIMKVTQLDIFGTGHPTFWFKSLFKKPYELEREKLEPLFELMENIASSHQATIVQVALNWLLNSHPKMIYIPGAKNLKQVSDNLSSLKWKLTSDEFQKISKLERELWNNYK
ncbi:aldo/keto reductase [Algoriphagus sp. AGSA1]|uniref:aldo/keto reductase n=1 Tax=Algoriphagus sp. AGSA1 TaxID=2907213 RepID=UPI001F15F830|nr:aldo/keto reductase [Algoriphagus sp. AGSA1]MCE7057060.1 aldo/keto reductase [Algoriphagus sp. AGSA1]